MPVKERIESKKSIFESKSAKAFFECAAFFLLGFFLSIGNLTKNLQPFGVSIISVSRGKNVFSKQPCRERSGKNSFGNI